MGRNCKELLGMARNGLQMTYNRLEMVKSELGRWQEFQELIWNGQEFQGWLAHDRMDMECLIGNQERDRNFKE